MLLKDALVKLLPTYHRGICSQCKHFASSRIWDGVWWDYCRVKHERMDSGEGTCKRWEK